MLKVSRFRFYQKEFRLINNIFKLCYLSSCVNRQAVGLKSGKPMCRYVRTHRHICFPYYQLTACRFTKREANQDMHRVARRLSLRYRFQRLTSHEQVELRKIRKYALFHFRRDVEAYLDPRHTRRGKDGRDRHLPQISCLRVLFYPTARS